MGRNLQTFESGNRAGLKLTPELSDLFVNTVKQTGRISIAAGRACVGTSTVRGWLRKGREENAEPIYREFADAVEKARAEFLAVAARRMGQMAIGGVLTLPKYDKANQLSRGADGEIEWEERYFPPNVNALAHVLDRIDPQPNLEPQQPGVPTPSEMSQEEQVARAAQHYDLWRESIRIMLELGVPMPQLALPAAAIETTASKVEP